MLAKVTGYICLLVIIFGFILIGNGLSISVTQNSSYMISGAIIVAGGVIGLAVYGKGANKVS